MYPSIEPYQTGQLPTEDKEFLLYWEESGNRNGLPILFLHGGPGGGTSPNHRSYFDPKVYRIILMDQRGCGKTTPFASLKNNTTWDLVDDIEQLREHLQIEKWIVFGGSWGSTLALTYAIQHPEKVRGLIVRGIFLGRKKEFQWFYQSGAHHILPDAWEKYLLPIPPEERHEMIAAYYKRLSSSDQNVRRAAAKAWTEWEGSALRLIFDPTIFADFTADEKVEAIARIECHYFMNNCFYPTENWILENCEKIRHIPAIIIHGRYDIICPFETAWELHKTWPEAQFEIVPNAGHAASDPPITEALVRATDQFRDLR